MAILLLVGTSGYWIPSLAPRILASFDVKVTNVYRTSEGMLAFEGLNYQGKEIVVDLDHLELPMPLGLLRDRFFRGPGNRNPMVFSHLSIQILGVEPTPDPPDAKTEALVSGEVMASLNHWLSLAYSWVPPIEGDDVVISFYKGDTPLKITSLNYKEARMKATISAWNDIPSLSLQMDWIAAEYILATLEMEDPLLSLSLRLFDFTPEGWQAEARIASGEQDIRISAEWGGNDWLPGKLMVHSDGFTYPDGFIVTTDPISTIEIRQMEFSWEYSRYEGILQASGKWEKDHFFADIHFQGDLEHLEVRLLEARTDWLQLDLNQPAVLSLSNGEIQSAFHFTAMANLSLQEYIDIQGKIHGDIRAGGNTNEEGYPVSFSLTARDLVYAEREFPELVLSGQYHDPLLRLDHAELRYNEKEVISVSGLFDLREQLIRELTGNLTLQGADLQYWTGNDVGVDFDHLEINFQAEGPLLSPVHSGEMVLKKVELPDIHPIDFDMEWAGVGLDSIRPVIEVQMPEDNSITAKMGFSMQDSFLSLELSFLEWISGKDLYLALDQPASLSLNLEQTDAWPWRGIALDPLVLRGEGRRFHLEWSESVIHQAIQGLNTSDFGFLYKQEMPLFSIHLLDIEIRRMNPWWQGGIDFQFSWYPGEGESPVSVILATKFSEEGVHLSRLQADYDGTTLVRGDLEIPLLLAESQKWIPRWEWIGEGILAGSLRGEWSDELREMILSIGGPYLQTGRMELSLEGTLSDPVARLDMGLEALTVPEKWFGMELPELRNLDLSLSVDAENLELQNARVELRDSAVQLSGQYPYQILLTSLESQEWDWEALLEQLTLDAELKNWKAEIWKDYLPVFLRRTGEISGVVRIQPGTDLTGTITAEGFAMRPTIYSPPVEEIRAELQFEGRTVRLIHSGASIGGGTLQVDGLIDWKDLQNPKYHLGIKGFNVPLVRTQDMIIRADLNLALLQEEGEEFPLIDGEINLKSSTILIDIDPLAPQIETGPRATPPFFSIDEYPFSEWRSSIAIRGQNFLRVRSAYFTTELSASMDLRGTLGQPLLLGSIRADGGRLRFPGSNMRIESAEAFITPESPNSLQIEMDAIGQNRIYVITMNVTGTVDQPRILFSASPTLTNAQILRILATGSLEGGGAGAIGLYLGQAFLGPGSGEDTFADRLDVEIGQEVTESGRSTIDVNYRLTDRWSVEGEYDRFDTYNLNLIRIIRVR